MTMLTVVNEDDHGDDAMTNDDNTAADDDVRTISATFI